MKGKKKPKPARKKTAPKKAGARKPATRKAVAYTPQPLSSTGWPPFRYPPA